MKINSKYGIHMNNIPSSPPHNTTKINMLETEQVDLETSINYLDETKKLRSCTVSNIDFSKKDLCCWWCKSQFDGPAWACPIDIKPLLVEKRYTSAISKSPYSIFEKTTGINDTGKKISFITEGIFCSINCCVAWVNENSPRDPVYRHSSVLLTQMYNFVLNTQEDFRQLPPPAPQWKMLDKFGGNLTLDEFRQNISKISYVDQGKSRINVFFSPLASWYEENLKF